MMLRLRTRLHPLSGALTALVIMLATVSTTPAAGATDPRMFVDTPQDGDTVAGTFVIAGWALDAASPSGTGVDSVTLFLDGPDGGGGTLLGSASSGQPRPDVPAALGLSQYFVPCGWSLTWNADRTAAGPHALYVYAHSMLSGSSQLIVRQFNVAVHGASAPQMNIDLPMPAVAVTGATSIAGWALDGGSPSGTGVDSVTVSLDAPRDVGGAVLGQATVGSPRPDVPAALALADRFTPCGWSLAWDTTTASSGAHTLHVYAHSTVSGDWQMSTRTVSVVHGDTAAGRSDPRVCIDAPQPAVETEGITTISGWALDAGAPTGTGVDDVAVYVDAGPADGGAPIGHAAYGAARPDVPLNLGLSSHFVACGWSFAWDTNTATVGAHRLYVVARSTYGSSLDVVTRDVTVRPTMAAAPDVWVDAPVADTVVDGVISIAGWALDRAATVGTGIDSVTISLDDETTGGGKLLGEAAGGGSRNDVPMNLGLPLHFADCGWTLSCDVSTVPGGRHVLHVHAHSSLSGRTSEVQVPFDVDGTAPGRWSVSVHYHGTTYGAYRLDDGTSGSGTGTYDSADHGFFLADGQMVPGQWADEEFHGQAVVTADWVSVIPGVSPIPPPAHVTLRIAAKAGWSSQTGLSIDGADATTPLEIQADAQDGLGNPCIESGDAFDRAGLSAGTRFFRVESRTGHVEKRFNQYVELAQTAAPWPETSGGRGSVGIDLSADIVEAVPLRYLAINVGNVDAAGQPYQWKLFAPPVCARIRQYIADWQPDIILISEVLKEEQLTGTVTTLLGDCGPVLPPGYEGVLGRTGLYDPGSELAGSDGYHHHEGVLWKSSRVAMVPGSLKAYSQTDPPPGGGDIDSDFSGVAVKVRLDGLDADDVITAVAVHPDSENDQARYETIRRFWNLLASDDGQHLNKRVIIGGDWNEDSIRNVLRTDTGVDLSGVRINYSSELSQHWDVMHEFRSEPSAVYFGLINRFMDHAFSTFGEPANDLADRYPTIYHHSDSAGHALYDNGNTPWGAVMGGTSHGHPRADGGDGCDHRQILVDMLIPLDAGDAAPGAPQNPG